MSKFEEMCQAYGRAQEEFRCFQDESHAFGEALWRKLMAYFDVPSAHVSLYSIDEVGGFQTATLPFSRILSLRDDGYWEYGIGINVFVKQEAQPRDTILLHLLLRRDLKGAGQARLGDEEQVFHMDPKAPNSFEPFLDYLFTTIQESYATGLERLLQEHTRQRIGFDLAEMAVAARSKTPRKTPASSPAQENE